MHPPPRRPSSSRRTDLPGLALILLALAACGPAGETAERDGPGDSPPALPPSGALPPLEGPTAWQGDLPCADCAGIRTTLILDPDGTYTRQDAYLGEAPDPDTLFVEIGRWVVADGREEVAVRGSGEAPGGFTVLADGGLRMLDRSGTPIVSELNYTLARLPAPVPLEGPVRIRGAFTYLADAASLVDCTSGIQLPVAMRNGYLALERAYLSAEPEPGTPLVVLLRGRVADEPAMEGNGTERVFVVDTLEDVLPDSPCPALAVADELATGEWSLTDLDGGPVPSVPPGETPTLSWVPTESRVAGTSGCNRYTGRGFMRGTELRVEAVASTRRLCEGVMELEARYLELLGLGGVLRPEAGALILSHGPDDVARFVRNEEP